MLTLRRFAALAESFGADLQHWPAEVQGDARRLLTTSAEARTVLDAAQRLDAAIGAARRREEAILWPPGELDAALARLRSGVAARIMPAGPRSRSGRLWLEWARLGLPGDTLRPNLGWLGFATSGGVAIVAGLLVGSLSLSPPKPDSLFAMLQAAPIHIFAD
jgi:hypothetical protein